MDELWHGTDFFRSMPFSFRAKVYYSRGAKIRITDSQKVFSEPKALSRAVISWERDAVFRQYTIPGGGFPELEA